MVMAWMIPGEDEQPATRRDVAKEREIIEASMRAGQAEMRTEMVEGFRQTDDKINKLSTEVDVRLTNQTRFLAGLMVVILAAVLSGG